MSEKRLSVYRLLLIGFVAYILWLLMLFFAIVDTHRSYLLYREAPPLPEWGPRAEAVIVGERELIFYYFDYRRHVFAYFPVIVQDGRIIRGATFSEYLALENFLRPHKEAKE